MALFESFDNLLVQYTSISNLVFGLVGLLALVSSLPGDIPATRK